MWNALVYGFLNAIHCCVNANYCGDPNYPCTKAGRHARFLRTQWVHVLQAGQCCGQHQWWDGVQRFTLALVCRRTRACQLKGKIGEASWHCTCLFPPSDAILALGTCARSCGEFLACCTVLREGRLLFL